MLEIIIIQFQNISYIKLYESYQIDISFFFHFSILLKKKSLFIFTITDSQSPKYVNLNDREIYETCAK